MLPYNVALLLTVGLCLVSVLHALMFVACLAGGQRIPVPIRARIDGTLAALPEYGRASTHLSLAAATAFVAWLIAAFPSLWMLTLAAIVGILVACEPAAQVYRRDASVARARVAAAGLALLVSVIPFQILVSSGSQVLG